MFRFIQYSDSVLTPHGGGEIVIHVATLYIRSRCAVSDRRRQKRLVLNKFCRHEVRRDMTRWRSECPTDNADRPSDKVGQAESGPNALTESIFHSKIRTKYDNLDDI